MSDKDAKKSEVGESSSSTINASQNNTDMPSAIKNVSVYLSFENCEKSDEKEKHLARITKLRQEGLKYLEETNWMYQNN